MINQEKVRKMTRAAILESGSGTRELNIARYRRADYITVQLLLSFVSGTFCYAAVAVVLITAFWPRLDQTLAADGVRGLIYLLIALYIVFILLYLLMSGLVAWKRYLHSHQLAEIYLQALHEIQAASKQPEDREEQEEDGTTAED